MPGTATGAVARNAERAPPSDRLPRRHVGDDDRDQRADGRRAYAQDHRVAERQLGGGELVENELDIVEGEVAERHNLSRDLRERCIEQRAVGQEHRVEQHCEGERQRDPFPRPEPDQARLALLAADHSVGAATEDHRLRTQQQHRQQQQRNGGGGGELRLGRILKQTPDLRRHRVETGRQREDRGRTEQRHRLQERDQRARKESRQRKRDGDPSRRRPRPAAEDG